jgi:hypothetical protein
MVKAKEKPVKCLTYQQTSAGHQAVNARFRDEVGMVDFEGLGFPAIEQSRDR